jgi:regulator of replication initiation timing
MTSPEQQPQSPEFRKLPLPPLSRLGVKSAPPTNPEESNTATQEAQQIPLPKRRKFLGFFGRIQDSLLNKVSENEAGTTERSLNALLRRLKTMETGQSVKCYVGGEEVVIIFDGLNPNRRPLYSINFPDYDPVDGLTKGEVLNELRIFSAEEEVPVLLSPKDSSHTPSQDSETASETQDEDLARQLKDMEDFPGKVFEGSDDTGYKWRFRYSENDTIELVGVGSGDSSSYKYSQSEFFALLEKSPGIKKAFEGADMLEASKLSARVDDLSEQNADLNDRQDQLGLTLGKVARQNRELGELAKEAIEQNSQALRENDELRKQIDALQQQIEELRAATQQQPAVQPVAETLPQTKGSLEGGTVVSDDPDVEADLDTTDKIGDQGPGEDTPENPQTLQVEPDPESQPNTPPNSPLLEINWDGAQTVETQTPEMQLTFLNYFNEIISNRDVKGGYGVEGSVKPPAQVLSELFNLFVSDGNIQPVEASLLQSIRSTIETQYIDHIATSSDQHSRVRVEEMLNPYLSPAELGKNICQLSVYLDGEQLENVLGGVRDRITSLSNGLEGEIKEAEKKQSEAAERKGFEQDLLDVYSEIVGDDFQQKSSLMYNLEPKLVYENGKYKPPEDSILDGIEYDILTRLYRGSNANLSKYSNEQIRTLTEKLKQYKEEQGS